MTTQLLNNRYQIIRALGTGGFGETFLAEDTHMPSKRQCVIKQLKPVTNAPQVYQLVQERFAREAAVLEQLGEGNRQIPSLYAYFESAGQFYLVQELIEGVTLTNKVRTEGPLSESAVKDILLSILPVLDYVHSRQMVHRDIKPDNIIVRGSDRKPVLIDFGAVKEAMGSVETPSGNVTDSIAIGTPGFMPSEQAAGRPVYSSDLYSLGLTAIYLLTGKTPQELETDPRTAEIFWQRQALNVSLSLASVLNKAIEFHPRDRFSSAREMLSALNSAAANVSESQPTVAIAPPAVQPRQPHNIAPDRPKTGNVSETQATVAVAPNAVQPIQPPEPTGDRKKAAIVAGALSLGIIALLALVVLSKQTEPESAPVAQQPAAPPTRSPAPTPATPSATKPTTPAPTPATPSATKPTTPATPSATKPTTPTPATSPTSTPATPRSPTSDAPPPVQAVLDYYSTINNRNYPGAWNQLSPRFKTNNGQDYNGAFLGWWKTVYRVKIGKVRVLEKNSQTATLDVDLTYEMQSGKVSSETRRFVLVRDAKSGSWLIDEAELI